MLNINGADFYTNICMQVSSQLYEYLIAEDIIQIKLEFLNWFNNMY